VRRALLIAGAAAVSFALPAAAQDAPKEPRRTRIVLGPQAYPKYPGSDDLSVGPMISLDRTRGSKPFEFEAPDESFGFDVIDSGVFTFGPVAEYEGGRDAEDVGANLPDVDGTIEVGAAAGFRLSDSFRVRAELRKGLGGHDGWISEAGADYVMRDGDKWLFSVGPRVAWSDDDYHNAWFGVTPAASLASGIPAYDPDGGIMSYGAAASFLTQLSEEWGIYSYAKYDRLTGDAADSPVVTLLGSRDQFSGGIGLSYTFEGSPW
jgi:outer membrane scaffolding protein for murein synthesis (MipA/OmpV family)